MKREDWCRKNLRSVEIRSPFVRGPGGEEGIWVDDGKPDTNTYARKPPVRHKVKERVLLAVLCFGGILFVAASLAILFSSWPTLKTAGGSIVCAVIGLLFLRYGFAMGDTLQIIEYKDSRDIIT